MKLKNLHAAPIIWDTLKTNLDKYYSDGLKAISKDRESSPISTAKDL